MAEATTVLGAGTIFKGDLRVEGAIRLHGTFEGSINGSGEVQVASGAICHADIDAESIVVEGKIEGNITARKRLTLGASAHVQGDVIAAAMAVSEGATYIGRCAVGPEAVSATTTRTAPAAPTHVNTRSNGVHEPKPNKIPIKPVSPEWLGDGGATERVTATAVPPAVSRPAWLNQTPAANSAES